MFGKITTYVVKMFCLQFKRWNQLNHQPVLKLLHFFLLACRQKQREFQNWLMMKLVPSFRLKTSYLYLDGCGHHFMPATAIFLTFFLNKPCLTIFGNCQIKPESFELFLLCHMYVYLAAEISFEQRCCGTFLQGSHFQG